MSSPHLMYTGLAGISHMKYNDTMNVSVLIAPVAFCNTIITESPRACQAYVVMFGAEPFQITAFAT